MNIAEYIKTVAPRLYREMSRRPDGSYPPSAPSNAATSTQSEASPEGNDGVPEAEDLTQRWGRAILAVEEQQRKTREALNPASRPTE